MALVDKTPAFYMQQKNQLQQKQNKKKVKKKYLITVKILFGIRITVQQSQRMDKKI